MNFEEVLQVLARLELEGVDGGVNSRKATHCLPLDHDEGG